MTDLHALLPDFSAAAQYAALLAGLETHRVSLSELLTLDAAEIGKRTRLPLVDLQRLCDAVREALAAESTRALRQPLAAESKREPIQPPPPPPPPQHVLPPQHRISTLDPALDHALAGGFPTGCLAEVVGESGAGKTQLLLGLLLAVQLPPPRGLGRKALYVAAEAPLPTTRLAQILRTHPDPALPVQLSKAERAGPAASFGLVVLDSVAANFRPFFGGGGGSAAAAAGAAGGGPRGSTSLAARSLELTRLGMLLRSLAQKHNLAVVVANQVADRLHGTTGAATATVSVGAGESPLAARSRRQQPQPPMPLLPSSSQPDNASSPHDDSASHHPVSSSAEPPSLPVITTSQDAVPPFSSQYIPPSPFPPPPPPPPPVLQLDHQQRWFTGWGDDVGSLGGGGGGGGGGGHNGGGNSSRNKTPALGLVWATQLSMRVALIKAPKLGGGGGTDNGGDDDDDDDDVDVDVRVYKNNNNRGAPRLRQSWRRWMKVVFAPHVAATGPSSGSTTAATSTAGGKPPSSKLAARMQGAVEFEITMGGLRGVTADQTNKRRL
ncbi:DNA repair protein [Niveomyces insectorum RCEF 264]|uniref:DNA repair protein n=1 Tax=Niveomyces insectorum RCEF 264 TaxID=1081102 RepID=A0A167Z8G3_9HYPO|nr:DNA repair protein [Niveomyces insectorum RCEF 264]